MIKFDKITQQTEDWFRIKYGKIGGSRAGGLLVASDTLLIEILSEMCEDFELDEDSFESKAMQRGNDLEPVAVRELSNYTGLNFLDIGWIEHETIKLIGISPDGLSADNKNACEVKCPSAKKHVEYIRGGVLPREYVSQCVHYFTVIEELENLHFASYRPENNLMPLFAITIDRHSVLNTGTEKRPVLKSVNELVYFNTQAAQKMEIDLKNEIEKINF